MYSGVGDLNGDGGLDLVYGSYDGKLYFYHLNSTSDSQQKGWPSFRGDKEVNTDQNQWDSDGDDLPDSLELNTLGSLSYSGDDDSDRDGSSNLNEWIAGTDLQDASDRLALGIAVPAGGQLQMSWLGQAGRSYQLICRKTLAGQDEWENLGDPIVAMNQELIEVTMPIDPELRACYFRVRVARQ